MKVVVLTTSYPRGADDVAGVFVHDAVEHLRAAGLEVDVVSPSARRAQRGLTRRRPAPSFRRRRDRHGDFEVVDQEGRHASGSHRSADRQATGAAVNLTSVTAVQLTMRRKTDATGAPVTGAAPIERVGSVLGDPTTGTVGYTFVAGDWTGGTAIPSGTYEAEWELTYNTGAIRTVPTEGYCYVVIGEDLD